MQGNDRAKAIPQKAMRLLVVNRYDGVSRAAPVSATTSNRSYKTAWQPEVARIPASASFIIASLSVEFNIRR